MSYEVPQLLIQRDNQIGESDLNSSRLNASLIALVLCIGLSQNNFAQRVAPTGPKPDPPPTSSKEPAHDYSQEALVIEQIKLTYRFEKDGTGIREQNFRARVQ